MSIITILNLAGLIIDIFGAFLMYRFTPAVNSQVYIYRQEEMKEIRRKDQSNQLMIRRGMLLLFIGFILQFIALFLANF